jgi:hypothetical protein
VHILDNVGWSRAGTDDVANRGWDYLILFSPWAGESDILGDIVDAVSVFYAFYGCEVDYYLGDGFEL